MMKKLIEDLLGEYWNLAFKEGSTGESQGDKANEVLHSIMTNVNTLLESQKQQGVKFNEGLHQEKEARISQQNHAQKWPFSNDPMTQLWFAPVIAQRDNTPLRLEQDNRVEKWLSETQEVKVGLLIDAASFASARGLVSGTSNWASTVLQYLKLNDPTPKHVLLVRDLAEILGVTHHDITKALNVLGKGIYSTNMYVSPDNAIEVANYFVAQRKPVGTAKELFTNSILEKLDVRPSTKVYLDNPPSSAPDAIVTSLTLGPDGVVRAGLDKELPIMAGVYLDRLPLVKHIYELEVPTDDNRKVTVFTSDQKLFSDEMHHKLCVIVDQPETQINWELIQEFWRKNSSHLDWFQLASLIEGAITNKP